MIVEMRSTPILVPHFINIRKDRTLCHVLVVDILFSSHLIILGE